MLLLYHHKKHHIINTVLARLTSQRTRGVGREGMQSGLPFLKEQLQWSLHGEPRIDQELLRRMRMRRWWRISRQEWWALRLLFIHLSLGHGDDGSRLWTRNTRSSFMHNNRVMVEAETYRGEKRWGHYRPWYPWDCRHRFYHCRIRWSVAAGTPSTCPGTPPTCTKHTTRKVSNPWGFLDHIKTRIPVGSDGAGIGRIDIAPAAAETESKVEITADLHQLFPSFSRTGKASWEEARWASERERERMQ